MPRPKTETGREAPQVKVRLPRTYYNALCKLGQQVLMLHLGDHDPSGIDMTRDNEDRIRGFMGPRQSGFRIIRVALNMDQVRQYNPPPNPAKLSDVRATRYIEEYGDESWELDALEPQVIAQLLRDEFETVIWAQFWEDDSAREVADKERLASLAEEWRNES